MKAWLDSSIQLPNDAGLRAAKTAGIDGWAGYMSTKDHVGLYSSWPKDHFDRIRAAGMRTMAYVSGWDDPVALRGQAEAWRVPICLDVEDGIRGLGLWTQLFLNLSKAGLYGNQNVHNSCYAPFRILYGTYGFDPKTTWRGNPPSEPHGFQWWNSHTEFGVSVDRCWFDDSIGNIAVSIGAIDMNDSVKRALVRLAFLAGLGHEPSVDGLAMWVAAIHDNGDNTENIIASILDSPEGIGWEQALHTTNPVASNIPPHTHDITSNIGGPK